VVQAASRELGRPYLHAALAREGGLARMAERFFSSPHVSSEVFFFFLVLRQFCLRGPNKAI
jgi:hypothetical protein